MCEFSPQYGIKATYSINFTQMHSCLGLFDHAGQLNEYKTSYQDFYEIYGGDASVQNHVRLIVHTSFPLGPQTFRGHVTSPGNRPGGNLSDCDNSRCRTWGHHWETSSFSFSSSEPVSPSLVSLLYRWIHRYTTTLSKLKINRGLKLASAYLYLSYLISNFGFFQRLNLSKLQSLQREKLH